MKLWLGWIITRALLVAGLWAGFVNGVQGAANIGLFMAWLLIVLSLLAQTKAVQEACARDPSPVPVWLNRTLQMLVLLFLIWHDAVITAAAWGLHAALIDVARQARKASERAPK